MRLLAALRWDVVNQWRNGFYAATAFVMAFWGVLLGFVHLDIVWLVPGLVIGNLLMNPFYFLCALLLLEKGEGTLAALGTTPFRRGEYLMSKCLTLGGLALLENLIIAGIFTRGALQWLPLIIGSILATGLFSLVAVALIARYESINTFLMPSILYTMFLSLPIGAFIMGIESPLLYLHPVQAPLLLMKAAIAPIPVWQWVYGCFYGVMWGLIALKYADKGLQKMTREA